jgi:hypothetical protein
MKLTEEDKTDLQIAAELRMMVSGPGWHHLERILTIHVKQMEQEILTPYSVARQGDSQLKAEDYREMVEGKKGALYGLQLALKTPKAIIANADDILAKVAPEERHVIEENL